MEMMIASHEMAHSPASAPQWQAFASVRMEYDPFVWLFARR